MYVLWLVTVKETLHACCVDLDYMVSTFFEGAQVWGPIVLGLIQAVIAFAIGKIIQIYCKRRKCGGAEFAMVSYL